MNKRKKTERANDEHQAQTRDLKIYSSYLATQTVSNESSLSRSKGTHYFKKFNYSKARKSALALIWGISEQNISAFLNEFISIRETA